MPNAQLQQAKLHVLRHFKGRKSAVTEFLLKEETSFEHFKAAKCKPDDPYTQAILQCLNITDEKKRTQLLKGEPSLYELLRRLYRQGHRQAKPLLSMIDSLKPSRLFWPISLSFAFIASVIAGIVAIRRPQLGDVILQWCIKAAQNVAKWARAFFVISRNLMLFSLGINSLLYVVNSISTLADQYRSPMQKFRRFLYQTLTSGAKISAYAIAFFVTGVMTPVVSSLFIFAEVCEVINGYVAAKARSKALRTLSAPNIEASFEEHADYLRQHSAFKTDRAIFFSRFIAALLTTAAVTISCIFPGNLLITAACIVAMFSISTLKRSHIKHVEHKAEDALQTAITAKDNELREGGAEGSARIDLNPGLSEEQKEHSSTLIMLRKQNVKLTEQRNSAQRDLGQAKELLAKIHLATAPASEQLPQPTQQPANAEHIRPPADDDVGLAAVPTT